MGWTELPGARHRLTPREEQIVKLVQRAQGVATIAHTLGLSQHTVKDHLKSVYQKLQVHSARELLVKLHGQARAALSLPELPFLGAAEAILAAGPASAVLPALRAAVQRCVRPCTVHALKWRMQGAQVELTATAPGLRSCLVVRVWAEAPVNDALSHGRLSPQAHTALRLAVPTWGFYVAVKPQLLLLVIADKRQPNLAPQDVKAVRLLVRLAETRVAELTHRVAGAGL